MEVKCIICSFASCFSGVKRNFRVYHCGNCRHSFVYPVPSNSKLRDIYSSNSGYAVREMAYFSDVVSPRAKALDKISGVAPMSGHEKVFFDFGCGNGHLLYQMKILGWSSYGCDMSDANRLFALFNGLQVLEDFSEIECSPKMKIDLLHFGDVLEHLPNPKDVLAEAIKYMSPSGVIYVRVPNGMCWFMRISRVLSSLPLNLPLFASEAPWHLHDFSEKSLTKLFDSLSCDVEFSGNKNNISIPYAVGCVGYFDEFKRKLKNCKGVFEKLKLFAGHPGVVIAVFALLPVVCVAWAMNAILRQNSYIEATISVR